MPDSLVSNDTSAPPYDWSVEVPEWRTSPPDGAEPTPPAHPAVDHGLPELTTAVPARHAGAGGDQRRPGTPTGTPDRRTGLTRRGRAVAATGVALAFLVGAALLAVSLAESAPVSATTGAPGAAGHPAADGTDAAAEPEAATITVEPGDTLWDIAERVHPGVDPRRTIHELVELNQLTEPGLRPGQRIDIPEF